MTYYHDIKSTYDFTTNEYIFEEVRSRIFFQKYYCPNTDKFIQLEDIIKVIGTEQDIKTIINACRNWTLHDLTKMAIVTCCINKDDIVKDPAVLKLLDFQISNTITGDIIINGGILFDKGKITFHT